MIVKLPIATLQVDCTTEPNIGCAGVAGCALMVTLAEAIEEQLPKVAFTVYVPAGAVTVLPLTVTPEDGLTLYV